MGCSTQIVISPLPSGSCLPEELYDYLATGIQIVAGDCGDCVCFVSQTTSPGPEQQGFRWELISSTGVPLFDQVFYDGEWRRYPSVPIGAEVFFSGDPSLYFNPVTNYGLHGGQWDGWQIDFSNAGHFPVIASSYSSSGLGWIINYQAVDVNLGGVPGITLDNTNTYRPATNALVTYLHQRPAQSGNFSLWGDNTDGPGSPETLIPADPGNTNPPLIPTFPTFVAKAIVKYVGLEGS